MEDAAVLRPEHGAPFVLTVDFITPIVDDPEAFGAIAAANALSDVYAMGGEPQVALAICGFPEERLGFDVLEAIFRGGRDKAAEAGCAIVGGHTVIDPELKYGLCVLGTVAPDRVLSQTAARIGDKLVLTKPIGFGIAAQAIKNQQIADADLEAVIAAMTTLNAGARDAALESGARAATDVTGFGLLGHLRNLLEASGHAGRVVAAAVPTFDFIRDLAEAGFVPGGSTTNMAYVEPVTRFDPALREADRLLLADAQTSGGLLLAIPPQREAKLLKELQAAGTLAHAVIGEVVEGAPGSLEVRSA